MAEKVGGRSEREEMPQVTEISHNKDLYRKEQEEITITRLRLDHTGLNGTMCKMVKSQVEECRSERKCGTHHITLQHVQNREGKTKRQGQIGRKGVEPDGDTGDRR